MKIQPNTIYHHCHTPSSTLQKALQTFCKRLEDQRWRSVFYQMFLDYYHPSDGVEKTELPDFCEAKRQIDRQKRKGDKKRKESEILPKVKEWLLQNWQNENLLIFVTSTTYRSSDSTRLRKIVEINDRGVIAKVHNSWQTYSTGWTGISHFVIDGVKVTLEEIANRISPINDKIESKTLKPDSDVLRLFAPLINADPQFEGNFDSYGILNRYFLIDLLLQCLDLDQAEGTLNKEIARECANRIKKYCWPSHWDESITVEKTIGFRAKKYADSE